jgi:murein DD-endopeptidase MepM/ murein hydrolase activator NlpD
MEEAQQKRSCIHPALLFILGLVVLGCLASFILDHKTGQSETGLGQTLMATRPAVALGDEQIFLPPYTFFQVNQGAHAGGGWWYGRLAVDIGNGRGTPIYSPINGWVSEAGADEFGSTYIVLENSRWRVLMMHGDYSVGLGEVVQAGQQVGTESNNGFTRGPGGEICNGAPGCGEHTHLAVWDNGVEVDPLELLR